MIHILLLLWLTITGGFFGLHYPKLFVINGWLAGACLIAFGWQIHRQRWLPLSLPLLAYWLLTVLMTAMAGSTGGIARTYLILILIAIYHLPVDLDRFRKSATWAGWIIFPLTMVWPWDNPNVLAMDIWGLFFLGLRPGWPGLLYAGMASIAMLATHSEGGLLAMLAGFAVYAWHRFGRGRTSWLAGLAGLIGLVWVGILISKAHEYGSVYLRFQVYQAALAGTTFWGNGAGTFHVVAYNGWSTWEHHNLFLTILWQTGIPGLATIAWLIYRVRERLIVPSWAGAWLAAFISHSLVDAPMFVNFISSVVLMIILGGLACQTKKKTALKSIMFGPSTA